MNNITVTGKVVGTPRCTTQDKTQTWIFHIVEEVCFITAKGQKKKSTQRWGVSLPFLPNGLADGVEVTVSGTVQANGMYRNIFGRSAVVPNRDRFLPEEEYDPEAIVSMEAPAASPETE